ncbi:threonylcarbamoyl-AMP synthase [Halobacteriales archaeon QH_10_67_22]|nr:MAG: threonylcarbamoyl-AMP synthase [Halobacteriales archaeon QH_10_67_22]
MALELEPTPANLRRVADCVREGGVVLSPSDTNMALGVDAANEDAIERLYEIKGRSREKPLTLFVRDPADWQQYGRPDDAGVAQRLVDAFWPGPLFLIVAATDQVPHERVQLDGTVSIGCIANPALRELMAHLDGPLAMSSANRSGTVDDDTLIDLELAREHVGDRVDAIVVGDPPPSATQATTIVDIADGPRVFREGDVTAADLNDVVDVF